MELIGGAAQFKQTDVGRIPQDWQTPSLDDLTVMMTNGFVGAATRHYAQHGDGVLYIQGYNVEENSFNFHGIKYVTKEFHRAHLKSCLRAGDLLTVQTGEVGLTTVVPESLAGSNCHGLIISRFLNHKVCPQFVSYYLNSPAGRARLRGIETGTTIKHLNVGDVLEFKIPLPPTLAEQEAIAEALSDADMLAASLKRLITKKRLIKQGTMQELFTGRKRLPGFEGEWDKRPLVNICLDDGLVRGPFGGALKKESFVPKGYRVYEQRNAIHRDATMCRYFVDQAKFNELRRFELKPGDFIGSCSGTIGRIFRIPKDAEPGIINQALLKITVDENVIDPAFFYHYFTWEKFQDQIIDSTQGGAMQNLVGMDVFKTTPFPVPFIEEQRAISRILDDMDAEVSALEAKLSKYGRIRQGMTHNLLTGKIRLV